jgi:CRISPR-associated protein Csc2
MTNPLVEHADRQLKAYSNFPQGKFVSLILIRKTESETLFRTEGSGEDLSKEFVRAGIADDEIIQRVVLTKRKQTAVERRAGRELLRINGKLYSSERAGGKCAMNGKPCGKCIDCLLYGYAVGKGDSDAVGAQKSRVMTEDSYSILKAGTVAAKRTFTGAYEDGTMRDPENKTQASNSFVPDEPYIKPETHFLEIETLKDLTLGELVYALGNVLRSTRYGAVSSRQGKVKNKLAG